MEPSCGWWTLHVGTLPVGQLQAGRGQVVECLHRLPTEGGQVLVAALRRPFADHDADRGAEEGGDLTQLEVAVEREEATR